LLLFYIESRLVGFDLGLLLRIIPAVLPARGFAASTLRSSDRTP